MRSMPLSSIVVLIGIRTNDVSPRYPACLCWYSIGRIDYGYGLNDPSEGGTLPHSHGRNIMGMFSYELYVTLRTLSETIGC